MKRSAPKRPLPFSATCPYCGHAFTPRYRRIGVPDQVFCSVPCAARAKTPTVQQYAALFWARVTRTDGCWLWTGPVMRQRRGYGTHATTLYGRKPAHRYSWFFTHGEMPPSHMDVCHACDVPACVRPDHLFLGTRAENMHDAKVKGRVPAGERHTAARLTDDNVREMRRLRASSGEPYARLAKRYGVSTSTVVQVIYGNTWRSVQP